MNAPVLVALCCLIAAQLIMLVLCMRRWGAEIDMLRDRIVALETVNDHELRLHARVERRGA